MPVAKVSASISGPSSRPRGLLVDTMQIVEPRKHVPVPDHLLNSSKFNIFTIFLYIQAFTLGVCWNLSHFMTWLSEMFPVVEIYSKLEQNEIVKASPSVIHFAGFEIGKTQKQKLSLGNVASEPQRFHIIPPQSKFFDIKYKKSVR